MITLDSAVPLNKVLYSTLAGAFVAILVYLIRQFAGVELPGEVVSATTVLTTFIVAYFVPLTKEEVKDVVKETKSV